MCVGKDEVGSSNLPRSSNKHLISSEIGCFSFSKVSFLVFKNRNIGAWEHLGTRKGFRGFRIPRRYPVAERIQSLFCPVSGLCPWHCSWLRKNFFRRFSHFFDFLLRNTPKRFWEHLGTQRRPALRRSAFPNCGLTITSQTHSDRALHQR